MFSIFRNGSRLMKLGMKMNDCKMFTDHVLFKNSGWKEKTEFIRQSFEQKYCNVASNSPGEEVNFNDITKGDEELEHKLKVILLEAEVMRQEGKLVPEKSFFTKEHWKELLSIPTRTARKRYLEYLFKLSKKKENRKVKQLEKKLKKEEYDKSKEIEDDEDIEKFAFKYDLSHNNIFLRFYDTTMNQMYNNRLIQAMMYGQKLVVDCGYDENMTKRENINCAKQLMLLFAENRLHDDPFDLHYCNISPNGILMTHLQRHIPNLYEPSFPLNLHQGSYLDIFPKDQLVYLTPHCKQEMTEFDHDAVYIIGAIVDKVNSEPLSLAKAKREGLRMTKLPLDKYLQWGSGAGKNLTLNQMVSILNDVKYRGDWNFALRHVPRRKIIDYAAINTINKSVGDQPYNRNSTEKKWTPSANINLDKLVFNRNKYKQNQ